MWSGFATRAGRPSTAMHRTASCWRQPASPRPRVIVVAIPDEHAAHLIVEHARELNPRIALVVRTHSVHHTRRRSAGVEGNVQAIHGELELGVQMTRYTLRRFGVSAIEAEAVAEGLRGRGGRPWPLDEGR